MTTSISVVGRRGLPGEKGVPGSNVQGPPGMMGFSGNKISHLTLK